MLNPKHIKEFENHLLANNKSKETIQSYMRTIKQFLNLINKIPEQIVKDDIEKYKYWTIEIKHYDRNSLTPKYCAIKTFLEFLDLPEKEIKSFKLNPPQIEVKPKIPLTRQEVQKIFDNSKNNHREHAILKTLYYSTIRSRELCNLNIEDIDFQRQKIRTISKGGHFDERNLHPDCLKAIGDYLALKEQPKEGHEKALFLNSKGERIGRTYLHLMIQKCASKAGINKRVYAHLFRASSITHMHNAGASIPEIMAQSKHRSVETLVKHYICPSEERYKEVYLNTLSFDNTTVNQKHKKGDSNNIQHKPQASELQQQLVQKLAQGEITNDVFIQAIHLLGYENGSQGCSN